MRVYLTDPERNEPGFSMYIKGKFILPCSFCRDMDKETFLYDTLTWDDGNMGVIGVCNDCYDYINKSDIKFRVRCPRVWIIE